MASVHKRASAIRDLLQHYVYLAEQAGIDTADRFLASTEKSFYDLARHRDMGAPVHLAAEKDWRRVLES